MSPKDDKSTVFTDLEKLFSCVGLTPFQRKVFEVLVRLNGDAGATKLAKLTGLKRPHTYQILDGLVELGLVSKITKGSIMSFSVNNLSHLVRRLEGKRSEITSAIDLAKQLAEELERKASVSDPSSSVRFVRGVEGVKSLYYETLSCKGGEIAAFADFENVFPESRDKGLNRWMWSYASDRARRGILYRGIVNRSKSSDLAWRRRNTQLRKLKMLRGVSLPAEINIFDHNVAIISAQADPYGILIKDQLVAATFLALHSILWSQLPDYRPSK